MTFIIVALILSALVIVSVGYIAQQAAASKAVFSAAVRMARAQHAHQYVNGDYTLLESDLQRLSPGAQESRSARAISYRMFFKENGALAIMVRSQSGLKSRAAAEVVLNGGRTDSVLCTGMTNTDREKLLLTLRRDDSIYDEVELLAL